MLYFKTAFMRVGHPHTHPTPLWYAVFRFFRPYAVRKWSVRSMQKSCYFVHRPQNLHKAHAVVNKKHDKYNIYSQSTSLLHIFDILSLFRSKHYRKLSSKPQKLTFARIIVHNMRKTTCVYFLFLI